MVITRGKYRGLKLSTLTGNETRPTLAKVKEAIFSMLHNNVYDATVLDLFAGSGNLGIEAISNGAKWVDFYDSNYQAIKVIKDNTQKLKEVNYQIKKADYKNAIQEIINNKKKYDLIFLDPPYHLKLGEELVSTFIDNDIVSEDGIIVCETGLDENINDEINGFEKYKDKKYGQSKIIMFRRR